MSIARSRSGGPVGWRSMFSAIALFSLLVAGHQSAQAAGTLKHAVVQHIPDAVATATPLGRMAPTTMDLDFVLPLRNQAQLTDDLNRIADPKDPMYGHYLTSQQFADKYGPSLADVNAVAKFAASKGLSLKAVSGNRTLIQVTGPSSAVERAFGVHLNNYQGADGRVFFAPDREPLFPADIAGRIVGLVGLDSARVYSPNTNPTSRRPSISDLPAFAQPLDNAQPQAAYGSGPNGDVAPNDTAKIYAIPFNSSPGSGQTLAVYELDGYAPLDVAYYNYHYWGFLPAVPLQNVLVDGYSGAAGSGAGEVTLDLEMMIGLCPYATKIICYEAPNGDPGIPDEYARIASDNLASVVSSSWGGSEHGTSPTTAATSENQSFQQMAMQGQSFFDASGDIGAYANQTSTSAGTLSVQDPASQPYATTVGGTLMNDSTSEAYVSESAWGDPSDTSRGLSGTGSGGGISAWWPIPSYQSGFANTSNKGSTTQRNVPDVSLFGDFDEGYYSTYLNGSFGGANGTSAAAPIWASFIAIVNQGRDGHSMPKIGFINPAVYSLAKNATSDANDFHDINDGTTNLYYPAVTGYDLATGIGSPKGAALYNDLVAYGVAATPTITSISPTSGPVGTVVTITGTNLGSITKIRFHNAYATTYSVNAGGTQIMVTVPSGAGTGTITVTTSTGAVTSSQTFTVTTAAVPTITSFTPTSGPIGTSVVITGTNFTGATAVSFHGTTATTFTVNSATQITATVPTGTTTGSISVTTPGGTATSSGSFTVTTSSLPTITSISPTSGPVGAAVTITGTNFVSITKIRFHNAYATAYTVTSSTKITVTVPSGAGTGTITVTTSAGAVTSSQTFTVTTASVPTITSFTPTSGSTGTSVTITGTNLTGASAVKFHGTTATTYTVNSATQITATVPTGTTTGSISVTTPGGTATSSANFTVTTSSVPTITAISPTSGPVGTVVTITGTNFASVTKIRFHNADATAYTVTSSTKITVTVPSGAGTGTITVTTSAGAVTSSQTFTVTTAAALSSLATSPSMVSESSAFTVTATLTAPAPAGGASVSLSLSGTPESPITIAAGQTSGSVTYTAGTTPGTYTFTASYGGATKTASFTVVAGPVLTNFYFTPSTVDGGDTTDGYVVFNQALTVATSITITSVYGFDATYTLQSGYTTYYFAYTPADTSSSYTDTFTATTSTSSLSANLTVDAP